jgi:hypothetical protein
LNSDRGEYSDSGMRRQIEDAVSEQLALLNRQKCTAVQFRRAIGQLAGASSEARWLVGATLAQLRRSGNLSDEVAPLIEPFATEANGVTVDLHPPTGSPVSTGLDAAGSISVGRVLRERYVILERLGIGGKGTVFKALDRYRTSLPNSQQHVAVKVLHTGSNGPEGAIRDLALELHCGQVLSHQNLVKVFELDRDGEIVFFTMELLDGESLSSLIERMSPTGMQSWQAWQIIRQLGAGLQHVRCHPRRPEATEHPGNAQWRASYP